MRITTTIDGLASRIASLQAERIRERIVAAALAELALRRREAVDAQPSLPGSPGQAPPEPSQPERSTHG